MKIHIRDSTPRKSLAFFTTSMSATNSTLGKIAAVLDGIRMHSKRRFVVYSCAAAYNFGCAGKRSSTTLRRSTAPWLLHRTR